MKYGENAQEISSVRRSSVMTDPVTVHFVRRLVVYEYKMDCLGMRMPEQIDHINAQARDGWRLVQIVPTLATASAISQQPQAAVLCYFERVLPLANGQAEAQFSVVSGSPRMA